MSSKNEINTVKHDETTIERLTLYSGYVMDLLIIARELCSQVRNGPQTEAEATYESETVTWKIRVRK